MTRYAVNIADLTRHDPTMLGLMLGPVVPSQEVVNRNDKNFDAGAVVLECVEERAVAIIRWLGQLDEKSKRYPTRAYVEGPRGGWQPFRG